MNQPMPPSSAAIPPIGPAHQLQEAYRRGYLAGHLAGWQDAADLYDVAPTSSKSLAPDAPKVSQPVQAGTQPGVVPGVVAPPSSLAAPTRGPHVAMPAQPQQLHRTSQPQQLQPTSQPQPQQLQPMAQRLGPQQPFPANFQQTQQNQQRPTGQQRFPQQMSSAPAPRSNFTWGLTPEQAATKKLKRESQNINITLYIACLLLVAAAALFIGSAAPASVRLVGTWSAVIFFYATGLVLHSTVQRLKPAAIAFTGTALAIIPFAGIATYNLGFTQAAAVWLITSILGTFAYIFAAVKLSSRLLVYLSMAFVLSTAWSSVAVVGAALAWYFTALIVISAAVMFVARQLAKRAERTPAQPSIYAKPLALLAPWFAPVGLVASLFFYPVLNAADHLLVLSVGAIYYGGLVALDQPKMRAINYLGLRLCVAVAAPFFGWILGETVVWAAGVAVVVLAVSTLMVCFLGRFVDSHIGAGRSRLDALISVPVVAALSLVWSAGLRWDSYPAEQFVLSPAVPLAIALLVALLAIPAMGIAGEATLALPLLFALVPTLLRAQDWTILLGVALLCAVVRSQVAKNVWLRRGYIVVARILVTGLVASLLTAFVPTYPGKMALIVTIIVVMSAGQLLADTFIGRYGSDNPVTPWSAVAWAVIGTALVANLATMMLGTTAMTSGGFVVNADVGFVIAAVSMGLATIVHSMLSVRDAKRLAPAEAMAPSYLVIAALAMSPALGSGATLIAWIVVVLYLVGMALRLRGSEAMSHRWLYWFAAMAAALALPSVFSTFLADNDAVLRIGNSTATQPQMTVWVLLIEALILTLALWRLRGPAATSAVLAATLGLSSFILAVTTISSVTTGRGGILVTITAGFAAAVTGSALIASVNLRNQRSNPLVFWVAYGAMMGLILGHLAELRAVEIVLVISVFVAVFSWLRAKVTTLAGGALSLARISSVILAGAVAAEFTSSSIIINFVLSLAVFAQLGLHWLLVKTRRPETLGSQLQLSASLWVSLAAQFLIPMVSLLIIRVAKPSSTDRWLIVIELLLLAVAALLVQGFFKLRGTSYLSIGSVAGIAAVIGPIAAPGVVTVMLTLATMAAVTWRCMRTPQNKEMQWYWLVAVTVFLVTTLVVDPGAPSLVQALGWLVTGLSLLVGCIVQRVQWVAIPGALMVWVGTGRGSDLILKDFDDAGFAYLACWATLVLVLGGFWMVAYRQLESQKLARYSITTVATVGGLMFAVVALVDSRWTLLAAAAISLTFALACLSLPTSARSIAIDVSIVVAALTWFFAFTVSFDLGGFWFLQWLAVAAGAIAGKRYVQKQPQQGRALLIVSACLISLGGLSTLLSGSVIQQLVTLVLFVALLAVGMFTDGRLFVIWGSIGVTTAVIWYLRGFTYPLLVLLAMALIGFVIWRLTRKKPDDVGTHHNPPSAPVMQQQQATAFHPQAGNLQFPNPSAQFQPTQSWQDQQRQDQYGQDQQRQDQYGQGQRQVANPYAPQTDPHQGQAQIPSRHPNQGPGPERYQGPVAPPS